MRGLWILALGILLTGPARAYTIYSISASELHEHQAIALRSLLSDARERDRLDLVTWLGDPGGDSDLPGAGVALRWHRSLSSGYGYGVALETHDSTMRGVLAAGEISRSLFESDSRALGATIVFGYQKMADGYSLSCRDRFGGYTELGVDELDYIALGAALHGEQRIGWLRLSLDLVYSQMRPRLEAGEPRLGSVEPCTEDREDFQNDLVLGAGLGVGDERFELYGGVLPSMLVLRLSAHF